MWGIKLVSKEGDAVEHEDEEDEDVVDKEEDEEEEDEEGEREGIGRELSQET